MRVGLVVLGIAIGMGLSCTRVGISVGEHGMGKGLRVCAIVIGVGTGV